MLAIDELGKGRRSDWELSILDEIISKRYNQKRTTIFTSNYGPKNGPSSQSGIVRENLRDRVGDRVFSRLHEMTQFIHVDAHDFRQ